MSIRSALSVLMMGALGVTCPAVGQEAPARRCALVLPASSQRIHQETGGIYLPAEGVLRVLVVFASFPDDETPHPYWSPHAPPSVMSEFIDQDTTTRSTGPLNLTQYFHQMSMGKLHVVGEAIWVESARSLTEYQNGAYGRANTDIIKERVDSLVDFSGYDRWSNSAPYANTMIPDGQVDMIIMVWRTAMFEFLGEASLGYRAGFVLDGKRIEMGFPDLLSNPRGSGITCTFRYNDTPGQMMSTVIHELGHWFMGGAHPYNNATLTGKHTYWGILCDPHRTSSCANAYERERLGWITVPLVDPGNDIALGDFVTTGDALKYHPPNGEQDEFLYIENHQRLSPFDDVTTNPGETGVWILQQEGPYMETDNFQVLPADGRWHWESPGKTSMCFGQELPLFSRGLPGVVHGASHRDELSTATSDVNWMYAYRDSAGVAKCGEFFKGMGFCGAFSPEDARVFSPTSNPAANTWAGQQMPLALEVTNIVGNRATVRVYASVVDAPPARRYVGRLADSLRSGKLRLSWGADWPDGQPLEVDFSSSELERMIGDAGTWEPVFQGSATQWTDTSLSFDSSGSIPVRFRARVRDVQGKYSTWSNVFVTQSSPSTFVGTNSLEGDAMPHQFALGQNYPNPFNPTTTINYQLSTTNRTRLAVYDILGREVAVLVDEVKDPGYYEALFDASRLASGLYVYRLDASALDGKTQYHQVKRMMLLK